jgi:hypothetical protein
LVLALCSLLFALCSLLFALCSLLIALCSSLSGVVARSSHHISFPSPSLRSLLFATSFSLSVSAPLPALRSALPAVRSPLPALRSPLFTTPSSASRSAPCRPIPVPVLTLRRAQSRHHRRHFRRHTDVAAHRACRGCGSFQATAAGCGGYGRRAFPSRSRYRSHLQALSLPLGPRARRCTDPIAIPHHPPSIPQGTLARAQGRTYPQGRKGREGGSSQGERCG